MENRRQFSRVLFSIKATLTLSEKNYAVSIHDISLNGALVTSPTDETSLQGQLGTLSFSLSDQQPDVEMHVAVIHHSEDELGLQVNAIDIDSITHLRRLIELNLGDEDQLNKELAQLNRFTE